ncbi:hypothetical protein BDY17DRAFT_312050 [Neohortaea acidophila]|uniref:Uncharacterized protein n=1 Tax=Neohortaea acidophila TaxID=245834 RepID=A0A6A6PN36_9PEZI|nr:uncharacterized protein BDY17DRAFT_312050 [Neohortaea acidophila]KAF2481325.1 hypothetical protein BDY17DRAFT_312050 [Neohortaea acidophila]
MSYRLWSLQHALRACDLPLDNLQYKAVIAQANSLPDAEANDYLCSILGTSNAALHFITVFNEYRADLAEQRAEIEAAESDSSPTSSPSASPAIRLPSPEP